eukprot:CAMPEP_0168764800 /NCGR_PEP_ID=MMETSP0724-20121128/25057_1 /TAXON_ID=265536 /ORGANISM="Amphiprora sp., Strain CCMP467" /LENGTH=210 /DNA_ID=CAMNT_0008814029 /DNA_START=167 /DNA_END=801 /DNA_ORIENTATION=+
MQARKRDGDDQEVGALVILVDQVIGLFQPKLNSSGGVALFPPVGYLLVWGALGLFYPPFEIGIGGILAASSGPGPTSSYVVTLPAGGTEAIASPSFSALNHLLIFVGGFAVALVVLKNANEMDGDEGLVNGDQSSPIEEESNPNKILMNLWDENFAPSKIRKSEDDEEVDDDNDSQKYVINSLYSSATEPFAEGNRFLPINQSTTSFVCL